MYVALRASQEVAAKLVEEQNREWRQLARGRRDVEQIESHQGRPHHLLFSRVMEGQQKGPKARMGGGGKENPCHGKGRCGHRWRRAEVGTAGGRAGGADSTKDGTPREVAMTTTLARKGPEVRGTRMIVGVLGVGLRKTNREANEGREGKDAMRSRPQKR